MTIETDRINDEKAMTESIEKQQQIDRIKAGLSAAERGEFATNAEMEQIFNRYLSFAEK